MDHKFCYSCGALLNSPLDKFCYVCGAEQHLTPTQKVQLENIQDIKKKEPKKRGPIANFFIKLLQCLGYYGFYFTVSNGVAILFEIVLSTILLMSSTGTITDEIIYGEFSKYYVYVGLITSAFIILGYFLFFKVRKKKFSEEIRIKKMSIVSFLELILIGLAAQFIVCGVLNFLYSLNPDLYQYSNSEAFETLYKNANPVAEFIDIAIFTPIFEEILFRGLIHTRLRKALPKPAAIILSSVIFAAAHMNLEQFCYVLPLAIVMAFSFEYFDSIFASIAIHMGFNASSYLMELFPENADILFYVICFACLGIFLLLFALLFMRKKEDTEVEII